MKIKENCTATTDDFWYDLTNGYFNLQEILENKEDIALILDAVNTIKSFQESCESQISDFYY